MDFDISWQYEMWLNGCGNQVIYSRIEPVFKYVQLKPDIQFSSKPNWPANDHMIKHIRPLIIRQIKDLSVGTKIVDWHAMKLHQKN